MSRSWGSPQPQPEDDTKAGLTFAEWAASRATALVAIGLLVTLLAILIVVSILHPR